MSKTGRAAVNWAVLGFVVSVLCYFAFFLLFNATGTTARVFYITVAIVCPPLAVDRLSGPWSMVVLPFVNAGLYAGAGWLVSSAWRRIVRPRVPRA